MNDACQALPLQGEGRAHRRHIQIISASGGGGRLRCALLYQLLMQFHPEPFSPDLAASLSGGLLFILLEYLVLHSEAELLFEQTADIDLPFGGGVG